MNRLEKLALWAARSKRTPQGAHLFTEMYAYPNGTRSHNGAYVIVGGPRTTAGERIPCNNKDELWDAIMDATRIVRQTQQLEEDDEEGGATIPA